MAKKDFSGNKGEWSEPYAVLRLLANGRLYQANENMLPSSGNFAQVLSAIRGDTQASINEQGDVIFNFVDKNGNVHNLATTREKLNRHATRLYHAICSVKKKEGAFELPSEQKELEFYGFKRLTNPAPKKIKVTKRDLTVKLDSTRTGIATLGFSVKSELGAPPTLLNASEATNIIYRIKGLSPEQAKEINQINCKNKIMARCSAIMKYASSIEFEAYNNQTFADNLDVVDSALPKMVADLVKIHYFTQILMPRQKVKGVKRLNDKLMTAVDLLSNTEPYVSKNRKNFCEIKIKRFIYNCALGMMPSDAWNGIDDASGGYIVVLPDGMLIAFYVYNRNLFEKYLYESTILERASTTKHKYMRLVLDRSTGDYLLKLNLQIRFIR